MDYNINDQAGIFTQYRDPESLEHELMLARKEILRLRGENEVLKATNIQMHNDLIQTQNDRDQTANLLRNREEELEVANIDTDLFRRHFTAQGSVTDYLNDRNGELLVALTDKETQFRTVAELCRKTFKQAFELRRRAIEAEEENESATQRMWDCSNESNAMARRLKRWRRRARAYKAALKVQKMRGLVSRNMMRAKIRYLVSMQNERRLAGKVRGYKLGKRSRNEIMNAEQDEVKVQN